MSASRLLALLFLVNFSVEARTQRTWPSDWITYRIPNQDTRKKLFKKDAEECLLEIAQLPDAGLPARRGAILLLPGLLHNARIFDLMPEQNVSYARFLRDTHGLRVYMLNFRGTGNSCYHKRSNLDDLAIDDIPTALRFLTELEKGKIYVFGHSQGGIALQASLAGLTRCEHKNCFDPLVGQERQALVRAAVFSGANVAMTGEHNAEGSKKTFLLEFLVAKPLAPLIDYIPASWVTRFISPSKKRVFGLFSGQRSFAYSNFWEYAYHIPNISKEARLAFYDLTMDSTSMGIVKQYAYGIRKGGIVNKSKESYAEALNAITIPVIQVAYEYDAFANPVATLRDNYPFIGSSQKEFVVMPGQGHEDFFLNADFQPMQGPWIDRFILMGQ